MADNFQDVAKQFVQFYYQQFDADREQLAPLYRDTSMLTYESESMTGVVPIISKLKVRTPPPLPPSPSFLISSSLRDGEMKSPKARTSGPTELMEQTI